MIYLVWNPGKLAMHCKFTPQNSLETYEGLCEMEAHDNCSWSSVVETSDIEGFLVAIYNETDVELSYYELPYGFRL